MSAQWNHRNDFGRHSREFRCQGLLESEAVRYQFPTRHVKVNYAERITCLLESWKIAKDNSANDDKLGTCGEQAQRADERAQRTAVDTEEAQARMPQPHIPCVASLSPPLCLPVVSFCVERF